MSMTRLGGLLLAAVVAAGGPAYAQDSLGSASMGEELAQSVCADCHAIERGERGTDLTGAPSFQDVADLSSATALSLRVFLRSPHLTMPNFALSNDQIDDLIAYIHSLR
ncbi:MAG: cytochrome c [Inquilinus sp.]|nr:cytochrome c [Inquilinus sp.]